MLDLGTPAPAAPSERIAVDHSDDYAHIRRAIAFLTESAEEQPDLDRLAAHLELSPAYCQRLFKRWCGLSPKEFVQAVTFDRARKLLDGDESVLGAKFVWGLYHTDQVSPDLEIPSWFVDPERACPATTYYESAMARGRLVAVDHPDDKARVLSTLMGRFQPEGRHAIVFVNE